MSQTLIVALVAPLCVGLLTLWIWMLVHCLKNEKFSGQDRLVWVIVIVALKFVGAGIYYFMRYRPGRAATVG